MELKSNKSSRMRDSGKSFMTKNSATKSKETDLDRVLKVASSKSPEGPITMDSL